VMELKAVGLEQHEEGGEREHKPNQGVQGEEDELARPQVSKWNGSASYPPIIPR
jgi:hypothetical protein